MGKIFTLRFGLTGTEAHGFCPLHMERTRDEKRPVVDRGLFKGVLGYVKFLVKELGTDLEVYKPLDKETAKYDEVTKVVTFDVLAGVPIEKDMSDVRSIVERSKPSAPYIISVKIV